jgi:hypothetical protein
MEVAMKTRPILDGVGCACAPSERNGAPGAPSKPKISFPEKSSLVNLSENPHEVGIEKQFSSGKS